MSKKDCLINYKIRILVVCHIAWNRKSLLQQLLIILWCDGCCVSCSMKVRIKMLKYVCNMQSIYSVSRVLKVLSKRELKIFCCISTIFCFLIYFLDTTNLKMSRKTSKLLLNNTRSNENDKEWLIAKNVRCKEILKIYRPYWKEPCRQSKD